MRPPCSRPHGAPRASQGTKARAPKRAVKTRKWLMTINFAKPQTERDALFVQNWIETKFKNSIYCDPSLATGTPLCEKIRMMLYVENRGRYKAEKAARKDTKDLSTAPPDEAVRRELLAHALLGRGLLRGPETSGCLHRAVGVGMSGRRAPC